MKPRIIQCPNCHQDISIDEVLTHQLQEELAKQKNTEIEEEKKKLRVQMEDWQKKEQAKISQTAKDQVDQELKLLKEQSEEKDKLLQEAREKELALRKSKNQLEDEKKAFELEKQRQLDEEREKIRQAAVTAESEKHRLLEAEKDKQLADMKKQIEELQQKANQGSQQTQGEVLELELEKLLGSEFPLDDITPVAKGVNGADIIQKIKDNQGKVCGVIVWESKRTKNWSEGWIQKLKEDCLKAKGDLAVLVTIAMPDGMRNFGLRDGIHITSFEHFFECCSNLTKKPLRPAKN